MDHKTLPKQIGYHIMDTTISITKKTSKTIILYTNFRKYSTSFKTFASINETSILMHSKKARRAGRICIIRAQTAISKENVITATYLYSTEHSKEALIINVLRNLVVNSFVILILPMIFGAEIVWFTFGIYELIVLVLAVFLLKDSEKDGFIRY